MSLALTSGAFSPGQAIPARYTCEGTDTSPSLGWSGAPANTAAFALIVDDPDAPGGVFTHWVLFNLPAGTNSLPEGVPNTERLGNGAAQGRNDFGKIGYGGPCPPPGKPHRYQFALYALDAALNLKPGASKQRVLGAMQGRILDQAQITGTYQRR